jgi:transcriptional regulator with XRE-family HTH domain
MPKRQTSGFDWQRAISQLGWSKAELARRMGIHVNTVGAWPSRGAPTYVEGFLRYALILHSNGEEVRAK